MPMRVCNYKYVGVVGGPIGFVPEEPLLLTYAVENMVIRFYKRGMQCVSLKF